MFGTSRRGQRSSRTYCIWSRPIGAGEVLALAVRDEQYRNAPGAGWLEVTEADLANPDTPALRHAGPGKCPARHLALVHEFVRPET